MKKKVEIILLVISVIFVIGVLCYPIMTKNIDEVENIYKEILLQNDNYYEYAKDIPLLKNKYDDCDNTDDISVDVSPESTFHIFKWGKVKLKYSKTCYNYNNSEETYSSTSIPVTLWIKKKDGHWYIVDYDEPV